MLKVIIKYPGEPVGSEAEISDDLKVMQTIVGGYIEVVAINDDDMLICNDAGKLVGLRHNFDTPRDEIVGPVIVVGTHGDAFADVSLSLDAWETLLREWGNDV